MRRILVFLLLALVAAPTLAASDSWTYEEFQATLDLPHSQAEWEFLRHPDLIIKYMRIAYPRFETRDCVHGSCAVFLPELLGREPSYREYADCEFGGRCDSTIAAYWRQKWEQGAVDTDGWGKADWLLAYLRLVVYPRSVSTAMRVRDDIVNGKRKEPKQFLPWCLDRASAAACGQVVVEEPKPEEPKPEEPKPPASGCEALLLSVKEQLLRTILMIPGETSTGVLKITVEGVDGR